MILLTLTAAANNLIHNKPSIISWVRYCEVITLTLSCPLSIKLSPVSLAGWRVVYSWGRLGSLPCVPEVWIFQIQCVGWTCACAFHAKFYRHIVALPKINTNTCYNPHHYHMCAFRTKFYCHIIALSKSNTDSQYNCHCFTMSACAFRTKFYCHIIALSKSNTDSQYNCHCFTMSACAFRTKFYCHIIALSKSNTDS